jgi:hypothetical protein
MEMSMGTMIMRIQKLMIQSRYKILFLKNIFSKRRKGLMMMEWMMVMNEGRISIKGIYMQKRINDWDQDKTTEINIKMKATLTINTQTIRNIKVSPLNKVKQTNFIFKKIMKVHRLISTHNSSNFNTNNICSHSKSLNIRCKIIS